MHNVIDGDNIGFWGTYVDLRGRTPESAARMRVAMGFDYIQSRIDTAIESEDPDRWLGEARAMIRKIQSTPEFWQIVCRGRHGDFLALCRDAGVLPDA